MIRPVLISVLVAVIAADLPAQKPEPLPAPDDVSLTLQTENKAEQFHLGELIPILFAYRAKVAGKYLYAPNAKLEGARPFEISCSPAAERPGLSPFLVEWTFFYRSLYASCGGVGAGVGGGSADQEIPLSTIPVSFSVPLNTYVRFRKPGTYSCHASSAELTATPREEKIRPALLLTSNETTLKIANDPAWSHLAAQSYAAAYEKFCRDAKPPDINPACFDAARRITYLDSVESLAEEVAVYDGKDHGWGNGFWEAIQTSSYPQEALRLMTERIQQPDFQASEMVVEWLGRTDFESRSPEAFQGGEPSVYHSEAVDTMRKYVRLLGSSLASKTPETLAESAKVYSRFASDTYCEASPLIPTEEQASALEAAGVKP